MPPWAKLALKVAPYAVALLASVLLWHKSVVIDRLKAEQSALVATYEQTRAEALAADTANAARVAAAYQKAKDEVSDDLEKKLDAARADADRYAARLRAQAAQGGGGASGVPGTAEPASGADGAGDATVVDDLRACSEAVVKAEGWREWWMKVSEVER